MLYRSSLRFMPIRSQFLLQGSSKSVRRQGQKRGKCVRRESAMRHVPCSAESKVLPGVLPNALRPAASAARMRPTTRNGMTRIACGEIDNRPKLERITSEARSIMSRSLANHLRNGAGAVRRVSKSSRCFPQLPKTSIRQLRPDHKTYKRDSCLFHSGSRVSLAYDASRSNLVFTVVASSRAT